MTTTHRPSLRANRRLTLAALLALPLLAMSASPLEAQTWARSFDFASGSQDEARAVRQTADGGFIVAGFTDQAVLASRAWVMKLDGMGNIQWEKTYGGSSLGEFARAIEPLASGGYVFVGQTNLGTNADIWVVNLNSDGTLNWQRSYDVSFFDDGHAIKELSGGGYIVVGDIVNTNGDEDIYALRLDSVGNIVWDHRFDAGSFDWGRSVWELSGGGFLLAGYAWNGMEYDIWILELTGGGMPIWERIFAGVNTGGVTSGDHAFAVSETSDQGLVIAGNTSKTNPSSPQDVWVIKLDAQRLLQWQKSYDSGSSDVAFAIEQTTDQGYIVGGYSFANPSNVNFWAVKLDPLGTVLWERTLGGSVGEEAYSVHQTADEGYVLAGYSQSMGPGDKDFWVARLDRNGEMDCTCDPLVGSAAPTVAAVSMGILQVGSVAAIPAGALSASPTVTVQNSSATAVPNCAGRTSSDLRANQAANGAHEQECSLAYDPADPNRQVLVYEDTPAAGPTGPSLGVSFSGDAGLSWSDRQIQHGCDGLDNDVPPDGLIDEETACDGLDDDLDGQVDEDTCCQLEHTHPSVGADHQGNFYVGFLAHESAATSFSGTSYVAAATSTDGGSSWSALPIADQSVYTSPGPSVDFLDRPSLVVDRDALSPQAGRVFVSWQRESWSNPQDSKIYLSASAGGTGPWSTPVQVNDPPGLQCAGAPQLSIGGGEVWVLWRNNPTVCTGLPAAQFFVDRSQNGGLSFGADLAGRQYNPIPTQLYKHGYNTADFISFVVDPTNPVVLHVAYAERTGGLDEGDILYTVSLDGGNSWSNPVRVNDDATIHPQYAPVVRAKTNNNGWTLVDLLWYDERHSVGCDRFNDDGDGQVDEEITNGLDDDGDGLFDEDVCDVLIDVYFARTVDSPGFNPTFSPSIRITTTSFGLPGNPPNTIGDYLSLAACEQTDFAAWGDSRGADNDVYTNIIPDIDSDGDTVLDQADCAPYDAGIFGRPGPVLNVQLTPVPATTNVTISWLSQDAVTGSSTDYDIVTGLASELAQDGGYSRASCLASDLADTPYVDTRPNPPMMDSYYYLVRAENLCRSGGYGHTSPSDPRFALSGVVPCP